MRRILILLLCLVFALAACKGKENATAEDISKDLKERGTRDLMAEAEKDEYTEPADGRITEAQIQMYLKVREHEKKIAEVAKQEMKQHAEKAEKAGEKSLGGLMEGFKAIGSAADFFTADIRAAKDLGYNTKEYTWVKGQIIAASTAAMAEQFTNAMATNMDQAYKDAKKAYDEATDDTTKKMYADVMATYESSKQEMKTQVDTDPALAYNRQLLSKHKDALNAYAHELSKFEDKPGEVQKSFDEMQKKTEEAKKQ